MAPFNDFSLVFVFEKQFGISAERIRGKKRVWKTG